MPELNDKDLDTLFRATGHHRAGNDLAARILAQVVVTPIHRPTPTPPLIGRWGWIAIAALLMLPLLSVLFTPTTGDAMWPTALRPMGEWLSDIQLTDARWPLWTLGASCVALLLVALDHYLGRAQGVLDRS